MENRIRIMHGDIIYSKNRSELAVFPGHYLVCSDGFVEGIYESLPEKYCHLSVQELGRGILIPAFSDMHIHVSQFPQRGIGMDRLLYDWLTTYTFPQEAKFSSTDYARQVYDAATSAMMKNGTFYGSMFTTIHRSSCDYLFERVKSLGMQAYVGKVNMDQNSPDFLCETCEDSLRETEQFLYDHAESGPVKPILTPRFAPTCSEKLMKGLGRLARKYHVGVQTHLVESLAEAQSGKNWAEGYACDTEIYEKTGLLGNGPSIFAHVIFPENRDMEILKKYNSLLVHCPEATTNIIAGIMKTQKLLAADRMSVGLGTDIGGGSSPAVYRQIALTVQLSKLRSFYFPDESGTVSFAQAFAMATLLPGELFDRVGSLAPGYRFDALVIDGLEDGGLTRALTPSERLERFCYTGDDRNITERILGGTTLN